MFPNKKLYRPIHKIKLNQLQLDEINIVRKFINNNIYVYEDIVCCCCQGVSTITISEYDRYGLPYKSNLCESCGLIYTSPRFNINSYKKFYDTSYRKIYTNYGGLEKKPS